MQPELILTFLLLVGLSVLATVDMAFGQLSDVGLRRLITEAEERSKLRSSEFLKQVLENRPRFSFATRSLFLHAIPKERCSFCCRSFVHYCR